MRSLIAYLLMLFSAGVSAEPVPAEHAEAVARAEQRGRELHAFDRAAWVATDEFVDRISKSKRKAVAGYVVVPREGGFTVVWIGGAKDALGAMFETDVDGATFKAASTRKLDAPRPLGPFEARLWRARSLAASQSFEACRPGYNVTVVPVGIDGADGFDVYLLAPMMSDDEVVLGKHYLLRIDPDAGSITSRREFSRSCIAGRMPPQAVAWGGTHLLDPTPTEIHVLVSLQTGKMLSLSTTSNSIMWSIQSGVIGYSGTLGSGR